MSDETDENQTDEMTPDEMTPDEFFNEVVCDGAPCPACCGACEVLTADLWQCESCGAVVTAKQIIDGPHNYEG